jgi:hypothetical protein
MCLNSHNLRRCAEESNRREALAAGALAVVVMYAKTYTI